MQGCAACERFGIGPQMNGLAQGPRQLPVLPIPKQVDPRTVTLVLGVAAAGIALAVFLYYTQRKDS